MAIICISGADASGKATQSKILAERLNATLFSFPAYETPAGQAILGHLTEKWTTKSPWAGDAPAISDADMKKLDALVLQSLMITNRLERGAEIREATRKGHVVTDRYDESALVYGALDGLDPAWLRRLNEQLPVQPDIYILIDVPVEEGFKRRPERRDRYESNREFLEKVRVEYLRLFADRQQERAEKIREIGISTREVEAVGGRLVRWVVVDGLGTIEEVSERIWRVCVEAGV